jgi:hypothetical protein
MTPDLNRLPFTPRTNLDTFAHPGGDSGVETALSSSIRMGLQGSFTGLGYRALKYFDLKNSASMGADYLSPERLKERFVTKDEWEKNYSYPGLQFEDNHKGMMSREYAAELMKDAIDDDLLASQANQGGHKTTATVGNLFGGFLSPADWAINLAIPETMPMKFGLGGTVASRAGTGVARLASRTVNGAINGAAFGALSQPAIFSLTSYTQQKYTLDDAMMGLALGPLIGGAAGAAHGTYTHFARGGELDRHFANAVLNSVLTDKDPTIPAKVAGLDPRISEAANNRRILTEAWQNVANKTGRTVESMKDIIFMAGPDPDPEWMAKIHENNPVGGRVVDAPKPELRSARSVIVDMLDNPDSANRDRVRLGKSDDELFLSDAWKKLFGQQLRFVDGGFADALGFSGFVRSSAPDVAYIRAGALHDRQNPAQSMMFLAGHELGHAIRHRDGQLWADMVTAMMQTSGEDKGALADAWRTVAKNNHEQGVWAGMTMSGKMDETFASVMGRAATSSDFWRNLHNRAPQSADKLSSYLFGLRSRLGKLLDRSISPSTKNLYDFLGTALMKADDQGRRFTDKLAKDPTSAERIAELYSSSTGTTTPSRRSPS